MALFLHFVCSLIQNTCSFSHGKHLLPASVDIFDCTGSATALLEMERTSERSDFPHNGRSS